MFVYSLYWFLSSLCPVHSSIFNKYPREVEKDFDPKILYTYEFLLTKPQFRFPIEVPSELCPSHWEYSGEDAIYKFSNKFNELYNDHYMEVEGDIVYDYDEEAEVTRDQYDL